MRITPELIENCYQYTNKATKDRELRMRGLKINAIENLGATLDQFDCIDLSENSIRKLENFPLLPRLKCLLLNNNRIFKIAPNLEEIIPNLERLILTNNYIQELGDIDTLSTLKNLKVLSLLNNPITTKPHYKYYVIHKLPNLRLLDFNKIKKSDRLESNKLFSGSDGFMLAQSIGIKSSNNIDDDFDHELKNKDEEFKKKRRIEDALNEELDSAGMQSIQRLNNLLKSGYVPGSRKKQDDLIDDIEIQDEEQITATTRESENIDEEPIIDQ